MAESAACSSVLDEYDLTDSVASELSQAGLGRWDSVEARNAHWAKSQIEGTAEAAEAVNWKANMKARVRAVDLKKLAPLRVAIIVIVSLALLSDFLLLTVVIPILPTVLEGTPDALIFLLFSAKAAVQIMANPPIGALVDKFGPRVPLLVSTLVLLISIVVFVVGLAALENGGGECTWELRQHAHRCAPRHHQHHTHNHTLLPSLFPTSHALSQKRSALQYIILLSARATQGLASAATMSGGMALIAMSNPDETRGRAMGVATAGIALGVLVGPVFGGVLGGAVALWLPFVVIGGFVLVDGIALLVLFLCFGPNVDALSRLCEVEAEVGAGGDDGAALDASAMGAGGTGSREDNSSLASLLRGPTASEDALPSVEQSENPFDTVSDETGVVPAASGGAEYPSCGNGERKIYCNARALLTGFAIFIANCAIALIEPLVPVMLASNFAWAKGKPLYQGLIFAVATVSYLVSTIFAGVLSDCKCIQTRRWLLLAIGLVAQAGGLALIALPLSTPSIAAVVVGLALTGAAMGFIDTPAQPILAAIAGDVQRVNRSAGGGAKVAQKESAAVRASGLDAPLLADASGGGASDDYVEDIGEGEEEEGEGTGAAYGAAFALYDISTSLGFVCGPLVAALFSTLHIEESAGPGGDRWKFFAILAPLAIVIALFAPLTSFIRR